MTKVFLALLLIWSPASAQISIAPKTDLATKSLAPTATVTVSPISNGVIFNSAFVKTLAARVNVYSAEGPVMLATSFGSQVAVLTDDGIPNGTYSVQFFFTYAAVSPVAKITTANSQTLAQCPLPDQQNWLSPERVCDSGTFEITDNRLAVAVQLASGSSAVLTRIVINAYPALRVR